LFRIGGVGEENNVASARFGFEQHVGGRGQRFEDEDAAAARINLQDSVPHTFALIDFLQLGDDVRHAVNRDGAEFVHRRKHVEDLYGGQIGQIHFRSSTADRNAHTS